MWGDRRVYAAKAAEAAGDTRKKMRRLAQELRALQGAQGLPLQAAAAILLRHDSDRPDKMRALITGALLPGHPSPTAQRFFAAYQWCVVSTGVSVVADRHARACIAYALSQKICRIGELSGWAYRVYLQMHIWDAHSVHGRKVLA